MNWPLAVYGVLIVALFVRFTDQETARGPVRLEASPSELRLVRVHHRLFYAILLAAPGEWLVRSRPGSWMQLGGAALFLAGIVGYRRAGGALGAQLSPLLAPREPVLLVEGGPYRRVRHPMYLAQLAMGAGAALSLGAHGTLLLTLALAIVLLHRIGREEELLAERLPAYGPYAKRTYRLVPYVY